MQMTGFAVVTVLPAMLIGLGAGFGGVWPGLALLYMTLFAALADRYVPRLLPDVAEGAEFPSGKGLSVVLGGLHFALLVAAIRGIGAEGIGAVNKIVTLIAAGLWFGQVSHPNAQ